MDMKVLQFQNKKLAERIEQRKRAEEELHKRIEQLENRQRTDDAVLMIVNRYWNQVLHAGIKYCILESSTVNYLYTGPSGFVECLSLDWKVLV